MTTNIAMQAHAVATRWDDYERACRNAANTEVFTRLETDLRKYRFLAWVARAKGQRITGAVAEIIAAAAERLGEVGGRG